MKTNLTSKMKFFESENGYNIKILPSDIDDDFRTVANHIDDKVGKDFVDETIATIVKTDYNAIATTDDTQTDILKTVLKPKCSAEIKITGVAVQDDYATEWVFARDVVVVIDGDGAVTVDVDSNTDAVKDDDDWKFDVASNDDADNPDVTLSVTGKADVNIIWNAKVEVTGVYWK